MLNNSTSIDSTQYSSLPTGDYDEPHEIEESMKRRLQRTHVDQDEDLDKLTISIQRLGQLSLNIAGEIEMQDGLVGLTDEEAETVSASAIELEGQMALAQRQAEATNCYLLLFIVIVLSITFIVFVYKEFLIR